jgi:hypothetical protein
LLSKNVKIRIHRTIILPVVLYGYERWSLIWRVESRLRALHSRMLRRISGFKRDEVTGQWRRLHTEELYALCSSHSMQQVWGRGEMHTGFWRETIILSVNVPYSN